MDDLKVYRAGVQVQPDDYREYLRAVLRLENVGVLMGAGTSRPAGGETLTGVWEHLTQTNKATLSWLQRERFLVDGNIGEQQALNIENVFDMLQTACSDLRRRNKPRLLHQYEFYLGQLRRAVLSGALLKEDWWSNLDSARSATELNLHRILIGRLLATRQPGQSSPYVFTTNYDMAIEWSAESLGTRVVNGFDGYHLRRFAPSNFDLGFRNVAARGEARFGAYNIYLVKLHGSLSWVQDGESVTEISTEAMWPRVSSFLASTGNQNWPGLVIFPEASKYSQTTTFVYGELFRRFIEFLSRPQTGLLVVGYSFSDQHINRVLESALQNPTLQLVFYCPELQTKPNSWINTLIKRKATQVTIVGMGEAAYFQSMTDHLPEPISFNSRKIIEATS